ncbi:MAG: hypothetical protein MUC89_18515 [Acetobacteraceae bacterium]|nr:hypothetical protein [Acetobacteraceae bacterium]
MTPPFPPRRAVPRFAALACAGLLLSGCGLSTGFSGSGNGFGGFGSRPAAITAEEADGYTMRRLRGLEDQVGGLQPDGTIRWPSELDEQRPSVFETEDERRSRESQPPVRRGSSSESPDIPRATREPTPPPAPRALAPPPEPELRGQAIPGAPAGTVSTGGTASGRTGTFGGPAGSGTTVRDGGTTTLMGADGTIRTVPTPR